MDDELKRRLAAALDAPDDAAADPEVVRVLEHDTQARAFSRGLYVIEHALRGMGAAERSSAQWEGFAEALEARLGEAPWERVAKVRGAMQPLTWDPLERPPLREEADDAMNSEHNVMAQSHDDKDDDDLEGLAALMRTSSTSASPSIPPASVKPGPALGDDAMDESSGIVDIQKLAAIALKQSVPPPAASLRPSDADTTGSTDAALRAGDVPAEAKGAASVPPASSAAETKARAKDAVATKATKADEKPKAAAVPAPTAAQPVEPAPAKKRSGAAIWIPLVGVAAVAGAVFVMNSNHNSAPASDQSTQARAEETVAPAAAAPAAPAEPAAQPAPPPAAAPAPAIAAAAPTTATGGDLGGQGGAAAADNAAPAGPAAGAAAPSANAEQRVAMAAPVAANEHEAGERARLGGVDGDRAEGTRGTAVAAHHASSTSAPAADESHRSGAHAAAATTGSTTVAAAEAPAAPAPAHGAATRSANTEAPGGGEPAPTPPAAAAPPAHQSIDDMMRRATGAPSAETQAHNEAAAAAAASSLPARPSRAQISESMSPLAGAVRACAQGATGTATVAMVIRNDGTIQSSSVSGPFEATVKSCIDGVVRRAHFPQFTQPTVPLVYPFSIQPPRPGG